jgi:hypothetical protein
MFRPKADDSNEHLFVVADGEHGLEFGARPEHSRADPKIPVKK